MTEIRETDDFAGLQELFYSNGLEISLGEPPPAGLLKCWEAVEAETGKRLGGVKLEMRAGRIVIGGIAVLDEYRGQNLGRKLLDTATAEAKSSGAESVLLVAKVPGFYQKAGFYEVDMEDYREITRCSTCAQRGESCFPKVMKLDVPPKKVIYK